MGCIVWAQAPCTLSCNPVIVITYISWKDWICSSKGYCVVCKWMVQLLFPSSRQPQHWKLAWGQSQKETAYQNTGCALFWSMQIRLLQAWAVKVNGDREGKLSEARYRSYKSSVEDGFYLSNYCLKEHDLISKTFGGSLSLNFFPFSAVKYCPLQNGYHTQNINVPNLCCMLRLLLCYHSLTGLGCKWFKL